MRHFLDCRSLTEMAFTLSVLSVLLVIPMTLVPMILLAILGSALGGVGMPAWDGMPAFSLLVSTALWGITVFALWLRFARIGRRWARPNLATNEFLLFQIAAGVFVLTLHFLFPWPETTSSISMVRGFFSVVSVLMNVVYVSLAFAIKASLPARIFIALAVDVAIASLPLLGK